MAVEWAALGVFGGVAYFTVGVLATALFRFRGEMSGLRRDLRAEMRQSEDRLRGEMRASFAQLRDELHSPVH